MLGNIILEDLCQRAAAGTLDRPLYLAVTVTSGTTSRCASALSLEGLLQRVVPGLPDARNQPVTNIPKTMELFTQKYRMDSATDLGINWQDYPAHLQLISNYTNILFRLGYDAAPVDQAIMEYGFERSLDLALFHHNENLTAMILENWETLDPGSEKLKLRRGDLR